VPARAADAAAVTEVVAALEASLYGHSEPGWVPRRPD
jgi:hypothetical protein